MKNKLRKIAFLLLGSNVRALFRLKRISSRKYLTILNLHRVCIDDGSAYKPLDPKIFEDLLCYLLKNYSLITFEDLDKNKPNKINKKPLLIITFDDGYKDFIEVAVPLLLKYQVKVNQNIIPDCVDSGYPPLNVLVQDFIGKSSEAQLSELDIPSFNIGTDISNRFLLGLRVSKFIKNKPMSEQIVLKKHILSQSDLFSDIKMTPMMNLDDIKQLIDLHEFGAHSYTHANMEFETDAYIKNDLKKCKNWFGNRLNRSVNIYAFPNGSYKDHHINFAIEAGYKHILLVDDKFSSNDAHAHRRFGFHADSVSEMKFRVSGGFYKI
jgi:peptidoglycan/xylan/chitin deacetylase (PgdA/CDA1 family)